MKRFLVTVTTSLVLAACSDTSTNPLPAAAPPETGPRLATAPVGPRWSIFTSQTPAETLQDVSAWEVSTRFHASKPGKIVGFRFWRAVGETGVNTAKLWTDGGTQLRSASFSSTGSGWREVYLSPASAYHINAGTSYRVSVNTNTNQVKTGGGMIGGITNGALTADGSHYGQPTGSMPTTGSASTFFIDVIFEEDVPLPDLYVGLIQVGAVNSSGDDIVRIDVCNTGPGAAAASYTRLQHNITPNTGGSYTDSDRYLATPAIASGTCATLLPVAISRIDAVNEYRVWADALDNVYESSESNNFRSHGWYR
jgi:hypothetical protein